MADPCHDVGFPLRADSVAPYFAWQVLEFAKKPEMSFEEWTNRQEKFQSFFGPGVIASLQETKQVHLHWHALCGSICRPILAVECFTCLQEQMSELENIAEVGIM